jgi:DNA-binding response OmpR family regulator
MHVLVAENESRLARVIRQGLREQGHSVDLAADGQGIVERVAGGPPYDLVVLDAGLPGRGGLEALKGLRAQGIDAPILLLTAEHRPDDTVIGLDLGADASLAKPFVLDEFLARVRALLRRRSESRAPLLRVSDLTLDPAAHLVARAGRRVRLTAREYALLEYLLRNPGRVLTRAMIIEHVWGHDVETASNLVDVYVGYLRGKIECPGAPPLLHTVRGVGYRLDAPS